MATVIPTLYCPYSSTITLNSESEGSVTVGQVIAIIEQLQALLVAWSNLEHSMLSPENIAFNYSRYLIPTEDGERNRLIPIVEEILAARTPDSIIRNIDTLTATRERVNRAAPRHLAQRHCISLVYQSVAQLNFEANAVLAMGRITRY